MGIVVFLIYILLCGVIYFVFLKLFKSRYITYYNKDVVDDSDDHTYITYKPEERYKEYISSYSIFANDDYKFAKIVLTEKVQYIDLNIICYKDKKIYKIVDFLNEIDNKDTKYVIKLPDGCEETKLIVREVNGKFFEHTDLLKRDVLWRSIVSSIILALSCISIIFAFRLASSNLENGYFDWQVIYTNLYFEPWIYIAAPILAIILGVSFFLILYLSNNIKYKKAKFNKIKRKGITKFVKIKVKRKVNKGFITFYAKLKSKRKYKIRTCDAKVTFYDSEDRVISEKELHFTKWKKRFNFFDVKDTKNVKVDIETADFKKYYYNGVIRKKVTKKGASCGFLSLNGVKKTSTIFFIFVFLLSAYSIFQYYSISGVNSDLKNFTFEYTDDTKTAYKITKYEGKSFRVVVPKSFNNKPVVSVGTRAFNENLYINELYFSGDIIIEDRAFLNCLNLRKVDFRYISSIGNYAFAGNVIYNIDLSRPMDIGNNAFQGNPYLFRLHINSPGINFGDDVFKSCKVTRMDFYAQGDKFSSATFNGCEINEGYVYKNETVNSKNVKIYFNGNVKAEEDCVHNNNSFFIRNGFYITSKSFDIATITIPPTCSKNGEADVICKYCGHHYITGVNKDPNAHEFIDGQCICGAKDPNYVPPVQDETDESLEENI